MPSAYTRMAPPAAAGSTCQLHHTSSPLIRVPRVAATAHPPPPARVPEVARAAARNAPTAADGSAQVACASARLALTLRTQLPTLKGAPLPLAHAHTVYEAPAAAGAGTALSTHSASAMARPAARAAADDREITSFASQALRGASR